MNEDDPDAAPRSAIDDIVPTPRHGRRQPGPLKVCIELVVVDGEAGKTLLRQQAAAVRDALRWFATNPLVDAGGNDDPDHSPEPGYDDLVDHPSRSCPLRDSYRRGSAAETGSRRWRPSSAMRCIRVKPSVVGLVDTTALEKVTVMNKDEPDATPIFQ
jgi:hypothetical protein